MNVESSLNDFYRQHGYGEGGGINRKWDMIKFGPISLPLPNLESRRRNIYLHDINHLVTGFDTPGKVKVRLLVGRLPLADGVPSILPGG
ncbi:hypothetical protein EXU85_22490 [Spirosoma sp. KCTC 42546]|uniref:hypothetical protein n=1 Tax=Spirosoma sp. KCTC 42546 TaxID=2520506 RepID=UPI00115B6BAF|nr:hypothetical protein [Spirosoma sp. KCTC 42546]QDK81225.1 hypothetical protein EXU85_22490 [Spirosoma sp. KCTC 42546]